MNSSFLLPSGMVLIHLNNFPLYALHWPVSPLPLTPSGPSVRLLYFCDCSCLLFPLPSLIIFSFFFSLYHLCYALLSSIYLCLWVYSPLYSFYFSVPFLFVGEVLSFLPMLVCSVGFIYLLLMLFVSLITVPGPFWSSLCRPCQYSTDFCIPFLGCWPCNSPHYLYQEVRL